MDTRGPSGVGVRQGPACRIDGAAAHPVCARVGFGGHRRIPRQREGQHLIAGRYTLDREIGRGGMGAVWLARDEILGRDVAIKRIGTAPGGESADLERAEREARLAARLNHPHVVAVFDLITEDDERWLVMEYVEGVTLSALVRRDGALTPDQAAPLHPAGGRRPDRRARRRDRAPRREAVEHPRHRGRAGEALGLRHRPRRGGRLADPDRSGHRLPRLPRARGGVRADGDGRQRRLVARRHAVPRPRRRARRTRSATT